MILFLTTHKRQLAIDDAYVAALSFLVFFAVGKIVKAVIEKQKRNIHIASPRGGNISVGLELTDDTELAEVILSCINDNEHYMIKDPRIIQIVFDLVKAKIKKESLVVTPNMIRFLALSLLSNDQTFIVKIGNILASSNNRIRLFARLMGAGVIGFLGALFSTLPYAVLIMVIYFDTTENCGYKCSDYFEELPKEGPVNIYEEKSTGHIFIGANDDARQIAVYVPSKNANEVSVNSDGSLKPTKQRFKKVRSKAKQVSFSDFKKTDPVLSSFSDLEEPDVPQNRCPISDDVHDVIGIRID